jgi:hypothetical protein
MTNLEQAQRFAMGFCLSEYPDDWTYEQVCEELGNDEPEEDDEGEYLVTVWHPFEYADVLEIMDGLVENVLRLLDEKDKK